MKNANAFGKRYSQVFKNISEFNFFVNSANDFDRIDFFSSSTLTARAKLLDENSALAKQNDELRLLLSKYMQSKVNQELQIPPSQIIQLQLSEQSSGNGPAVY